MLFFVKNNFLKFFLIFFKKSKKTFDKKMDLLYYIGALCLRGVAQFGSARGLGPWGREFESLHLDQSKRRGL